MPVNSNVTKNIVRELVAESLRTNFVAFPQSQINMTQEEAKCYRNVTEKTLQLHEAICKGGSLSEITKLIKQRNTLLEQWKVVFGFPYPL